MQVPTALPVQETEGASEPSALSVADVVVTEYEKLLAAIPTMTKHIGKLQSDTEAMAEGLGKRVRDLVEGYRELNGLVEQAPSRVGDAASEYVKGLDVRPRRLESAMPDDVADGHVAASGVEGIHQDLVALREAKLALDHVVMISSANLEDPIVERSTRAKCGTRWNIGSAQGGTGLSRRAEGRYEQVHRSRGSSVTFAMQGGSMGGRAGDVATARAQAGDIGTKRSTGRRVLAEIQLDPDLPLPLPTFPGNGSRNTLRGVEQQQRVNEVDGKGQYSHNKQPQKTDDPPVGTKNAHQGVKSPEVHDHGYYIPGIVTPRQRQSHGLPQELRAISTVPTLEERPIQAAGSGKRRRMSARPRAASIRTGTATTPLRGPQAAAATSGYRRVGASSPRPDPGSEAAMVLSREQRRYTRRAVNELKKEMREREGRLERELDKLRRSRLQRVKSASPSAFGDASGREPLKVLPKSAPAGGRSGAGFARGGRGPEGRRPLPSALVSQKNQAAAPSLPADEKNERRRERNPESSQPVNKSAEMIDAQAQTANDRVHLFLHPEPSIEDVLRTAADERRPIRKEVLTSKSIAQVQKTRRGMVCGHRRSFDDTSFTSSSVSERDSGLSHRLGNGRRESPPPPVVFIEGEGRNASWRPSDDDRLLRRDRGGNGDKTFRRGGTTSSARADVIREVGDAGDTRLVLITAAEDKEEVVNSKPQAVRVSTEGLEAASSTAQQLAAGEHNAAWVELAGLLGLSASEPTGTGLSRTLAPAVQPSAGKTERPLTNASVVYPELVGFMREIVGQQRDMGQERSALLQALRAEVESRRLFLANEELSLRERELALVKKESESVAASATSPLAAAASATAAVAEQHRQKEEGGSGTIPIDGVVEDELSARPSTEERFWPSTSDHNAEPAESNSELSRTESRASVQEKQCSDGCGEDSKQEHLYAFRSNLGRVLAAGGGWKYASLDKDQAPGRVFVTSLGRVLAGSPACERHLHAPTHDAYGGASQRMSNRSNDHTPYTGPANTTYAENGTGVQEPLPRADEQGAGRGNTDVTRRGDTDVSFPETNATKTATALESPRLYMAMAEPEEKTSVERGKGDERPCSGREDEKNEWSASSHQQPQRKDSGRLTLSLATAVLSVALRLNTIEERASAKAEGAEVLARKALEDVRREGKEARERQAELMLRFEEIELGSERRANVVARDIAELREEGRLGRRRADQSPTQAEAHTLPCHSSPNRSGDSCNSSESGMLLDAVCPTAVSSRSAAYDQPAPARSESRSSMSEGQLRGFFSDGELLGSTSRSTSRYTLEDGEIPATLLRPPLPRREGSAIEAVGKIEGRESGERGQPRQHLALLMSAHPHLEANRPPVRGPREQADARGGNGGAGAFDEWGLYDGQRRAGSLREGSAGITLQMDDRLSRTWGLRPPQPTIKPTCPKEKSTSENRVSNGDSETSTGDSGPTLEPGQAHISVRRSWQGSLMLGSDGHRGICGRGAGADEIQPGFSWHRQRQAASEDSAPSVGEASSGVEMGEATFAGASMDELSSDAGVTGKKREGTGARNMRPLVAMKAGAGSSRRGQLTEIQRAIAEAELDFRSLSAAECISFAPGSTTSEGDGTAEDCSKAAAARKNHEIAVTRDLHGHGVNEPVMEEGVGLRGGLEPGEVP
ncbi:unnamed protein product [Scytosiphon promiscuus]